jgi:D-alanyl-D-alanine carboxypeptidase
MLMATLACGLAGPSLADGSKHAAMVIDANTGETLLAEQADQPRYPASLTKLMTIYLTLQEIERGRLKMTSRIKISQEAAAAAPSKTDLEPGEGITVSDAIKVLITKSANDVAVALAEHIAGSEKRFAEMMTEKARAMGMAATTFRNASGLPDAGQVTTARDMLTLALRLIDDFPQHYPLFALRAFSFAGATYRTHNTLLLTYEGTDGLKTGYTRMSGFNVVTSVRRGSRHVVAAVFGGDTAASRNATMRTILNRTLLRAAPVKSRRPAPMLVATARPAERAQRTTRAEPRSAPTPAPASPPLQPATAPPTRPLARPAPASAPASTPALPVAAAFDPPSERPLAREPAPAPAAAPLSPENVAASPTAEPPRIEVATVRRVMVAPRREAPAAGPSAGSVERAEPLRIAASPPSAPSPHIPLTAAAGGPVRGAPPSTLAAQAARLEQSSAETIASSPITSNPRLAFGGPLLAQRAAEPPPATVSRSAGPAATVPIAPAIAAAPVRSSDFQLQVGAFATVGEAERHLASVRQRAGIQLARSSQIAIPVAKEQRTLYRARFTGFDAVTAASTCAELRRQQIDCFVMRAEQR